MCNIYTYEQSKEDIRQEHENDCFFYYQSLCGRKYKF
jgi:hypothetical protein